MVHAPCDELGIARRDCIQDLVDRSENNLIELSMVVLVL